MKFCPKCRSFYDDEDLAFCQTDGVPLVRLGQSNKLWSEGETAVATKREILRRQTRTQKIKRISRILITTVMMIMVVTVIATNIYLYFPANEDEKAENIMPSPSLSPKPEETQIVINSPSPAKSATPKITQTPTITPSPTKSPVVCSPQKEEAIIKNFNVLIWLKKILPEKPAILNQNHKVAAGRADAEPGIKDVAAKVSPDCKSASVFVKYQWTIVPINLPPKSVPREQIFSCRKEGKWKC